MKKGQNAVAPWMLTGFLLTSYLNGCAEFQSHWPHGSRDHAYIRYWPAPPDNKQIRLAVKDNIDMKGVVTSAGSAYLIKTNPPAATDADCLAITRQRNVRIVGKANLTEFGVAPSGLNDYFGTPKNPFNKLGKLIPGGRGRQRKRRRCLWNGYRGFHPRARSLLRCCWPEDDVWSHFQ
jgi:amidase